MQPGLRYLSLHLSVEREDDGFDDAVRAMREIGLVGAVMGDSEERPPDATMALLACDADGRALCSIEGEVLAMEPAAVVEHLAARVGGSVALYEDGLDLVAEVARTPSIEWSPAPARWAWWIVPRGGRAAGDVVRRVLGSGSVEVALGDGRLAVGAVTTYPSWPRQVLSAIGVTEDSTTLAIHVRAGAGLADVSLLWWRAPLPLVEEPGAAVVHAQSEIVSRMAAEPSARVPEDDIRRALETLGRGEHADAMLALLDERLESDTAERALALLDAPDALLLALRGEVDVAGLPGAVRHRGR